MNYTGIPFGLIALRLSFVWTTKRSSEDRDLMMMLLSKRSCAIDWYQPPLFYNSGIKNLPVYWKKCVSKFEDYIEK